MTLTHSCGCTETEPCERAAEIFAGYDSIPNAQDRLMRHLMQTMLVDGRPLALASLSERITVYLPERVHRELRKICAQRGETLSVVVTDAVVAHLGSQQ